MEQLKTQMLQEQEKLFEHWQIKYDTLKLFYETELQKVDESYGLKLSSKVMDQKQAAQPLNREQQIELFQLELNRRDQIVLQQQQELAKKLDEIQTLENILQQWKNQRSEEDNTNEQRINDLKAHISKIESEYNEKEKQYAIVKEQLQNQNTANPQNIAVQVEKKHRSKKNKKKEPTVDLNEREGLLEKDKKAQYKYPTLEEMHCACIFCGCKWWWCSKMGHCHFCC